MRLVVQSFVGALSLLLSGCMVESSEPYTLPTEIFSCSKGFSAPSCNPNAAVAAMDRLEKRRFAEIVSATTNPMFASVALSGSSDAIRYGLQGRSCAAFRKDAEALPGIWASAKLKPTATGTQRFDNKILTSYIKAAVAYSKAKAGC